MDVDVVVAGAGPTGLMLACELAVAGVSVLVVERLPDGDREAMTGATGGRSVNAATAHALHWHGLLAGVRDAADWWHDPQLAAAAPQPAESPVSGTPKFVGHFSGLAVRADRLDHSALGENPLGTGAIAQPAIEAVLARDAQRRGVEILRDSPLTDLRADEDGVVVTAGGRTVRAGWLVGCDGGGSRVRKLAGFAFPGSDAEFVGRLALVDLVDPDDVLPVGTWTPTARGAYVHGPVRGRLHTVEYDVEIPDRSSPVTREEMESSIRRASGLDVRVAALHSATRYTDAARQVVDYRRGRVLLAGDAAHVHSPFGGQGMNLGLGDAMNLGWKLAATVRGWAPQGLLDSYTTERRPVGAWVLAWCRAQTALGRTDGASQALRSVFADLVDTRDGATYVTSSITGAWQTYDLPGEHPLVGTRAPDVALDDATTLAEHARDGAALLLPGAGSAPAWPGPVHVVTARPVDPTVPCGLLVRPDGYVVWADDGPADRTGSVATRTTARA